MFENLSNLKNLKFLTAKSPEELQAQILSITLPVKLVSIYGMNGTHFAWIQTDVKIIKRKKEDNGSS